MEELSSPKLFCKRQRLACSSSKPNRRHLRSVRWYNAKHHDWDWMLIIVTTPRYSGKSVPSVTIWSFCSLKRGLTVKVFLSEFNKNSIPVILQVIQQRAASLQTLLGHFCTQETFSFYLSDQLGHSVDWNFVLLYQSCHFRAWVVFEVFLMASWLTTRGLPDRWQSFRNSEAFKRCSILWIVVLLLMFNFFEISVFLRLGRNKFDISILLASIRQYLTYSNFL